jgi:hypothetical protein
MPRRNNRVPEQETRGGDKVDWRNAEPGKPLPELPAESYPEPHSEPLPVLLPEHEYDLGGEG